MKHMTILGLDIGEQRVGVALANTTFKLPSPLTTLQNNDTFDAQLQHLIDEHKVDILVVGLPRNLSGDNTPQTHYTERIAKSLKRFGLPIFLQDEAGTSQKAKDELGSKKKPYAKKDIDALAATYILEDFLAVLPDDLEKKQGDV